MHVAEDNKKVGWLENFALAVQPRLPEKGEDKDSAA